jgi:Icc-related predicted phosphoesterase
MDDSKLWYPEIVHSGANTSFASFYMPKVNEMLRNTPNHHVGSNGVEWILRKFGTAK